MGIKDQYLNRKPKFLADKSINKHNRDLFKKFLEWEEYKLKRTNELRNLDDGCYMTLYGYIKMFTNVNKWFKNKPLKDITKADIKKVYDDLEDGKIKNKKGKPFKCPKSYYNRIFKSKPFEMIHKADLAKEVMEYSKKDNGEDVRFIEEDTFRKLVNVAISPQHKLLLWLAFDVGENINSLLQLRKKHIVKQHNKHTKQPEYVINLPQEILKRARKTRSEITNFKETVDYLDIILKDLKHDDDLIFPFGYRQASKILDRVVDITKAVCIPKGEKVSFKDLRSSMACYLLNKGWTTDEINARLGHKPSSREIDKYSNFLAIDREKPKKRIHESDLLELKEEMEESKRREKLSQTRIERLTNQNQKLREDMEQSTKDILKTVKEMIEEAKL